MVVRSLNEVDMRIKHPPACRCRDADSGFRNWNARVKRAPIRGHDDRYMVTELLEGYGQSARHIRQPACLGKPRDLRSCE